MTQGQEQSFAERLGMVSLFGALAEAQLDSIRKLLAPFDVQQGHVLVQPGMPGTGLFLIEEGTVALTVHDREIELGPGEFFGELALLDDSVRTTRVRAKTPVSGYVINRDDFMTLLEAEPKIALVMLRVLAQRLVDLVTHH